MSEEKRETEEEKIIRKLKKILRQLTEDGYIVKTGLGDSVADLQEELRRLSRLETPLNEEAQRLLAWGQGLSYL